MQLQDLPPYELAVLLVPFLGVIVSRIVTGEMQKLKLLVYSQGAASVLAVIGFVANICGIIKCSTLCSGMINFDQLAFILVALISFIAAVVIC